MSNSLNIPVLKYSCMKGLQSFKHSNIRMDYHIFYAYRQVKVMGQIFHGCEKQGNSHFWAK